MRFGRHRPAPPTEPEVDVVDPVPAFVETVEQMPVQCLMFDDDGRPTVFAALALDVDDLIVLNTIMSELPEHPPVSPASWLDRYLDRWHHGRFAGWRVRREHSGLGQDVAVHPDLGTRPLRYVHPSAGVHVNGMYVRYGTGLATGERKVTVDHDQRCAEILFRRTVEAGIPVQDIAALRPHSTCLGVTAPPLPDRGATAPASVGERADLPTLPAAPVFPDAGVIVPYTPAAAPAAAEPLLTGADADDLRSIVAAAVGRSMALPPESERGRGAASVAEPRLPELQPT